MTMTVNELIQELQYLVEDGKGDTEVYFGCDYGDYCHTEQALPVKYIEDGELVRSAYSLSGKAFKRTDEDDEDYDESEESSENKVIKLC